MSKKKFPFEKRNRQSPKDCNPEPYAPLMFLSGLPRSGSTLLLNLLAQNPNHFVTPTNDLIELFSCVQRSWPNFQAFQAQGIENVLPFVRNSLKGMLEGFYSDQFDRGLTVFDKSRAWPAHIEDLEKILGREVIVICCIRDVRSILGSFEKLYRNRDIEYRYPIEDIYWQAQTVVGRSEVLLADNGIVGGPINRVMDALERFKTKKKRVHIVSYGSLCEDPIGELSKLHKALGLKPWKKYNPRKVEQTTKEDDTVFGFQNLHKIKPEVKAPKADNWEKYLPKDYSNDILQRYFELETMAQSFNKS